MVTVDDLALSIYRQVRHLGTEHEVLVQYDHIRVNYRKGQTASGIPNIQHEDYLNGATTEENLELIAVRIRQYFDNTHAQLP